MAIKVKAIPDGYHTVTPYLIIKNAASAIDFYKRAFGATEILRMADDKGKVQHAEIKIGDSPIMLADECPQMEALSPERLGGCPISIMLYVEDVDQFVDRARSAGAAITSPIEDKFYGDRMGSLKDPYGHQWHIATHKEDVSEDELKKRAAAMPARA